VVSVLPTGLKFCGFASGQRDGILGAIKSAAHFSFGLEVKPELPCRKILRYVKEL
jgi:hypothetical protein